jgi:hypothetical protein
MRCQYSRPASSHSAIVSPARVAQRAVRAHVLGDAHEEPARLEHGRARRVYLGHRLPISVAATLSSGPRPLTRFSVENAARHLR